MSRAIRAVSGVTPRARTQSSRATLQTPHDEPRHQHGDEAAGEPPKPIASVIIVAQTATATSGTCRLTISYRARITESSTFLSIGIPIILVQRTRIGQVHEKYGKNHLFRCVFYDDHREQMFAGSVPPTTPVDGGTVPPMAG